MAQQQDLTSNKQDVRDTNATSDAFHLDVLPESKHKASKSAGAAAVEPGATGQKRAKLDSDKCNSAKGLYVDRAFKEKDWARHTSSRRFWPQPLYLLKVIVALKLPLVVVLLVAICCGIYESVRVHHRPGNPALADLDLSFAYSVVGFALSLLLVFKTNTAYGRYWEARSSWGPVNVYCFDFIIKAQTYLHDAPLPVRQMLLRWTIALPYLLRSHVLYYKPGADSLQELLTEPEIQWLRRNPEHGDGVVHQPMLAVTMLSSILQLQGLDPITRQNMMEELEGYMRSVGICDKLCRFPIPYTYSMHTTRFLLVYLACLPLALWAKLGWATAVVAPLIALLLAGIENIGAKIENPMCILPMAGYCAGLHKNLLTVGSAWAAGSQQAGVPSATRFLTMGAADWQHTGPTQADMPACGGSLPDGKEY